MLPAAFYTDLLRYLRRACRSLQEWSQRKIPNHWQDHFTMAGLIVDPSKLNLWVNAVSKSLATGVFAHINGDMAESLVTAYKSFSAKYTGVPPLDTFKDDFFKANIKVFEKVRLTLVNELVNRGAGLGTFGKSVDPKFASEAAAAVNIGLNISEIYGWREKAWNKAKEKLRAVEAFESMCSASSDGWRPRRWMLPFRQNETASLLPIAPGFILCSPYTRAGRRDSRSRLDFDVTSVSAHARPGNESRNPKVGRAQLFFCSRNRMDRSL